MVLIICVLSAFIAGLLVGAFHGYDLGWGWGWIGHGDGDIDPWEQIRRLRREKRNSKRDRLRALALAEDAEFQASLVAQAVELEGRIRRCEVESDGLSQDELAERIIPKEGEL